MVSGFWHGANWTFIIWGLLNALYFLPLLLLKKNRNNIGTVAEGRCLPNYKEITSMMITFSLTVFAWIFFRADSVTSAFAYIKGMLKPSLLSLPQLLPISLFALLIFFIIIEWIGRENQYAIEKFGLKWAKPIRWGFYYLIVVLIFVFMGKEQEFIYFQF